MLCTLLNLRHSARKADSCGAAGALDRVLKRRRSRDCNAMAAWCLCEIASNSFDLLCYWANQLTCSQCNPPDMLPGPSPVSSI